MLTVGRVRCRAAPHASRAGANRNASARLSEPTATVATSGIWFGRRTPTRLRLEGCRNAHSATAAIGKPLECARLPDCDWKAIGMRTPTLPQLESHWNAFPKAGREPR